VSRRSGPRDSTWHRCPDSAFAPRQYPRRDKRRCCVEVLGSSQDARHDVHPVMILSAWKSVIRKGCLIVFPLSRFLARGGLAFPSGGSKMAMQVSVKAPVRSGPNYRS
jgi:hypothetical protein